MANLERQGPDWPYDPDGRIKSYTDADGFTLSYAYDAAGNITSVTYPDGSAVTYAYDAANRLTTVTNWSGGQTAYTYDQDGRLASLTRFNGITTNYTYDAASRLTGMASSVSSYQMTLDRDGNRVGITESQPLEAPAPTAGSTAYTYNTQQDRLLSAGDMSYAYDSEGQLASSTIAGIQMAYTFDYNHRLSGIGSDTEFSYDDLGNRLIAIRAGVVTHYVYDPWGNLVAIADGSNNITEKFVYGRGLLAMATSSGLYCYHFDPNGNAVALTDTTGSVVDSYAYGAFGEILAQQEAVPQPFKYVGQFGVMAEPSGLYYMRARYYDPSVGRFISEDPLGFGGGDVNLYAYVLNDPVNFLDPYGLAALYDGESGEAIDQQALVSGGGGGLGESDVPLLSANAGPVAKISPGEVIGKTPAEIDAGARQLGLKPVGPDPAAGKGAYIDPQTRTQRILVHPDACPPHGHVNNAEGERIGPDGLPVPPESPAAHLPINLSVP